MPTFDTRHNLIKGGSWISTGNEAIRHSRYAFRRHFYQHAGFRYIDSELDAPDPSTYASQQTESDQQVCRWIDAHYNLQQFPREIQALCSNKTFPQRLVDWLSRHIRFDAQNRLSRVADIGCAAGRLTFELAPYAECIQGLDQSARIIRVCAQLQFEQRLQFLTRTDGELEQFNELDLAQVFPTISSASAVAAATGIAATPRADWLDHIEFMQADACNLEPKYTDYDLVVAANLVEDLIYPHAFLSLVGSRVRSCGYLCITTTGRWNSERTPKEHWLGGRKESGESVDTLDAIRSELSEDFEVVDHTDLYTVTRTSLRNFDLALSYCLLLRRR